MAYITKKSIKPEMLGDVGFTLDEKPEYITKKEKKTEYIKKKETPRFCKFRDIVFRESECFFWKLIKNIIGKVAFHTSKKSNFINIL